MIKARECDIRFCVVISMLKGMFIGFSELVPNVGGASLAYIGGTFERMIKSIVNINSAFFSLLMHGKFKDAVKHADLCYLVSLLLGFISILIINCYTEIGDIINSHTDYIYSIFFGLIIGHLLCASIKLFQKSNIQKDKLQILFLITLFFVAMFLPNHLNNIEKQYLVSQEFTQIVAGIMVAIFIFLPSINIDYVLLKIGSHSAIGEIITELHLMPLLLFAVSFIVTAIVMARIFNYFIVNYRYYYTSLMSGILIGSLYNIWPFQEWANIYTANHEIIFNLRPIIPEINMRLIISSILIFVTLIASFFYSRKNLFISEKIIAKKKTGKK